MMIEQVKCETKATVEDLKEYQVKHSTEDNAVVILDADIPLDGFYRDRIRELTKANTVLREENAKLKKELNEANHIIEYNSANAEKAHELRQEEVHRRYAEYETRISKLEKALVEATIR